MSKACSKDESFRILIIRFSSIGDIILTSSIIPILKKNFPNIRIDYLTLSQYKNLLIYNPNIENVLLIDRNKGVAHISRNMVNYRRKKYKYIFDLHRSSRSLVFSLFLRSERRFVVKKHYFKRFLLVKLNINLYKEPYSVVNKYLKVARFLNPDLEEKSEIWVAIDELNSAINKLRRAVGEILYLSDELSARIKIEKGIVRFKKGRVISLMPFAKWGTKEWGDNKYIELGCRLTEDSETTVLILGGKEDIIRSEEIAHKIGKQAIPFAGGLSLSETAIALSISDCLITNDTGIMHMGGAVSIPVISLFGSTSEELGFFPHMTEGEVVELPLDCRPCTTKGFMRCPKGHFRCMNDILVERVYSIVRKYL